MNKKEYMKPAMQVDELQQDCLMLSASKDAYGMSKRIVTDSQDEDYDEVTEGW